MRPEPETTRYRPARVFVTLFVFAVMFVSLPVAGGDLAGAQETTAGGSTTTASGGSTNAQQATPAIPEPKLDDESWALIDAESGRYLTGENADKQLALASTTKIMVALVALDEGVNLDQQVTVPKDAEAYVGNLYSNVGLIAGERLSIRDLLKAILIPSATEGAYTLAEYLGGGNTDNFVEQMNQKASSMGLQNTHFDNPAGLSSSQHYSSARDLAAIAHAAMKYPLFAQIVDTKDDTISTQNRTINISNTNQLLTTYPKTTGIKTGTSPEAGPSLVSSAQDGDESYIGVVLGAPTSDQRFLDSQTILEYGFARYNRQTLVKKDEVYDEEPIPYRSDTVELAAKEDVATAVDANSQVERRVTTGELPPSAAAGDQIGQVEVLVDGQSVGSSPLVAREGYEEASLWDKAWSRVTGLFG